MKTVLYNTLKRMIERGLTDAQAEDLIEKMDVFCAVGSLSLKDYQELRAMIGGDTEEA